MELHDVRAHNVLLHPPAVLEVLCNDGGWEGDDTAEDPDTADSQQYTQTRRLRLQRLDYSLE